MPNTKITSRGDTVRKCAFCPFQSSNHTIWRDHMAQCYENRFFCKQCDYSTDKKINYLRHVKRNHSTRQSEKNDHPSCSKVTEDTCDDHTVEDTQSSENISSKGTEGDNDGSASEDEDAWLAEDPDVSIGEAIETVQLERRSQETERRSTCDPAVRKRTSPMPVYSPAPPKVARPCSIMIESEQRDPPVQSARSADLQTERDMVDSCTQTEPVRYTKSITTTTIVRENGRKVITVKKEKML